MPPSRRSQAALALILWACIGAALAGCSVPVETPRAVDGEIALADWDFDRASVDLQGDWAVCWGQLLEPGDPCPTEWASVGVRGLWSDDSARSPFGGKGVATYRLRITLPIDPESEFALSAGVPLTAYRLWIDGVDRGGAGVVGPDADSTSSEPRRNRVFSLARADREIELHVQLANFEFRGGGIRRPWIIGHSTAIQRLSGGTTLRDALLATISALVGIASLLQFFLRRSEISRSWFGGFAIVMAGRMIPGSISDFAQLIVPWASFSQLLRFEYLGTALAIVTGLGYIGAKFPALLPPRMVGGMQLLGLAIAPIVVLGPMNVVLETLPFFLVMPPVAGALVILALTRSWWRGATEVRVTLLASLLFVGAVVHDVIRTSVTNFGLAIELFPYFFVVWISVEAFELAAKFARSFQREEARSDELGDLNFELQETEAAVVRFAPFDLLALLGKPSVDEIEPGDHVRRVMSVLHCDFGDLADSVQSDASGNGVRRLNELTERVSFPVRDHGGFVSELRSEGLQAIFPGGANDATEAATAILAVLASEDASLPDVAIGIDTGLLVVGVLGDESQLIGSAIGPARARAERLAKRAHATAGRLVVSAETRAEFDDGAPFETRPMPADASEPNGEGDDAYAVDPID